MDAIPLGGEVGVLTVSVTNSGLPVDYWAKLASEKIISVGGNAHPAIVDQAREFKEQIEVTVAQYMQKAIDSYKETLVGQLKAQGHGDLAAIIRSM